MTSLSSLKVRPAQASDEEAVVVLWRACGLVVGHNDPRDDFAFARRGPNSDVLMAEDDGRVRATVMVGHDGHRGWLYYVAVELDFRGEGAGRAIVGAGEDWLRARGIRKVQLLVRETNPEAVSFYERIGFEISPRTVLAKWLSP